MAVEAKEVVSLEKGTNKVPPMVYGETGYAGLVTLGGQVWDECQHEVRWPHAYKTFKKMAMDATIAPALEFVEGKIAEATWKVKIPKGVSKERETLLKAQAQFIRECMDDMDHSWTAGIKNAATFNRYGFSLLEIVFRYRNKKYGSKFDDGKVGLGGLPPRSQGTVQEWLWENNNRTLRGINQRVILPGNTKLEAGGWTFVNMVTDGQMGVKFIPYKKLLHFRHNAQNDSPSGTSPLVGAWQPWKLKAAYLESEAIGVAQDNNAFKVLYLPPEYLVDDADEDRKQSYEMYKRMMEKAHQAKQSGFILPLMTDESGNRMFDFEIKNISGAKSYDVGAIIARLTREIQVALHADVLSMGGGSGGSYSLSESKVGILDLAVKTRLTEIKDQFNHKLIPSLFEQNGWDTDVIPYLDFELPNSDTLETVGKYLQMTSATGLLPLVPEVVNFALARVGIDYRVDDDMTPEELRKIMTNFTSESGGGLEKGLPGSNGDGTGSNGDPDTANKGS